MEIITYSILQGKKTSDEYYERIEQFTIDVCDKICSDALHYIHQYRQYVQQSCPEKSMPELIIYLEYLIIGVLWNTYVERAVTLPKLPGRMLHSMVNIRKKRRWKGIMDFFRGILGTVFLSKRSSPHKPSYTLENFIQLNQWLKASGEFRFIVDRLEIWSVFMQTLSAKEVKKLLKDASDLGLWFDTKSEQTLGVYTPNVNQFIKENDKKMIWQEHRIFCTRRRVEYHLNMVGAQIMNKAFREGFLKTKEKRVLLPICMRGKPASECQAKKTHNGFRCTGCTHNCIVHQVTKLGRLHNFKVYIIPHASTAFSNQNVQRGEIGIVGIACVLNLITGGYEAKAIGFEPQCVLLDFCGCQKHWHKKGLMTEINYDVLKKILCY